jgi:peptide/nickel transport system substrate-binding protein
MSRRLRGIVVAAAILMSLAVLSAAGGAGAETPKRGGTVYMPGGPEPACITPYIVACAGGPQITFMDYLDRAVLPGAYEYRRDLTWKAQLVSHVDVSTKPPLRLTLHIRPEARWSDGVPVSAADFVFTYRTLVKYKERLDQVYQVLVGKIRRVRALDGKTVRVVLDWDMTAWRAGLFSTVLPQHVLAGEDYLTVWRERIENPKTGEPVGSGPFLVAGWDRGKQLILVRNPRYWGPRAAYVRRVALRFGLEGTPATWLASGAVDVAWGVDSQVVASFRSVPATKVLSTPAIAHAHISINVGHRLLQKRFVRRALAYGIDRQAIVKRLFGVTLPKQQALQNGFYPQSSPYYRATWARYPYRPAESRRLLERGGCERGTDGIFVCEGDRLSLRFVTRGDVPSRVTTLGLVRDQLRNVGIEIVPVFGSGDVVVNRALATGDYDLLEWTGRFPDPPAEYALNPTIMCLDPPRGFSWTRYCQRLDPAELSRANHTLRGRERARAVNEVDAALAEEVPLLPLYWVPTIAATGPSVRGYVLHPDDPFWRAEEWWLEAER